MKGVIRNVVAVAFTAVVIAIHAASAASCGSGDDCTTACENQEKLCGRSTGCSGCTASEKLATDAACTAKYDSLMACLANESSCFMIGDSCTSANDAWHVCLSPFCIKSSNNMHECNAVDTLF